MIGLTAQQRKVLDVIRESVATKGYPPTLREIGAHMGIRSTNGVNDHLRCLERKGWIVREDMKVRSIRVIKADGNEQLPVPAAPPSAAAWSDMERALSVALRGYKMIMVGSDGRIVAEPAREVARALRSLMVDAEVAAAVKSGRTLD